MSDCECEKNKTRDNWIEEGDYGDDYLREESFNIIDKIKKGLTYYGFNENAIFNRKMGQRQINDMNIDEVNIDYSYLNEEDETELLEETIEEEYLENREETPVEELISGDEEVTPSEIDMILDEREETPEREEVTPSEIDMILDEREETPEKEEVIRVPRTPTSRIVTDKEVDEILEAELDIEEVTPSGIDMILDERKFTPEIEEVITAKRTHNLKKVTEKELDEILKDELI